MNDRVPESVPLIRTFRAADAREALAAVKAAFGADAVILETKQVAGGLFRRPSLEVTAAAATSAGAPSGLGSGFSSNSAAAGLRRALGAAAYGVDRRADDEPRPAPRRRARAGDTLDGSRWDAADGRARDGDDELDADGRRLLRHLLDRGLDAEDAQALVHEVRAQGAMGGSDLFGAAARVLGKSLPTAQSPWSVDARRTIALVGPTGVGKTTAIAKIAARALLETRFKVGLITVDTYRVGASDQLARYGKIMGIATHVARDRAGLQQAVDRTRDADLVLIDTAGRSDAASLAAQVELVRAAPNVQLHLVLSATASTRDLRATAKKYRDFNPERLIFTKLDEAAAPAACVSAIAALPRPVSCVCDGQRVPEDIHPVTSESLVERLLGTEPSWAAASLGMFSHLGSEREEMVRGSGR